MQPMHETPVYQAWASSVWAALMQSREFLIRTTPGTIKGEFHAVARFSAARNSPPLR